MKIRKPTIDEGNAFEHGKVQPQAVDLEEAVLGAIMLEPLIQRKIVYILRPEHFYKDQHKWIYQAIISLVDKDSPADILTVTQELKRMGELEGAGGAYYITQLTNRVASSANVEYHAHIIIQKYIMRELIRVSSETIRLAFEDTMDVFDLLEDTEKRISMLSPIKSERVTVDTDDIVERAKGIIFSPQSGSIALAGTYLTGWPEFDKIVSIGPDRTVLLTGANGDGKSRFVASMMFTLLDKYPDISVYWNSFEDSATDIAMFYLAKHLQIKSKDLRKKGYKLNMEDEQQAHLLLDQFKSFDLKFVEVSDRIADIKKKFSFFCQDRRDKLNILIIDNLMSLMDAVDFRHNRNDFYDYVATMVQNIRQATGAMILIIHHFNDAATARELIKTGFRPVEKDIKGTERIRAISNQILLVNNPERKKELLGEYVEDRKENLIRMFIVEACKVRDDNVEGDTSLIHFFKNLDILAFQEIRKIPLKKKITLFDVPILPGVINKNDDMPF